jgi:PAS domain S-box-containing protein
MVKQVIPRAGLKYRLLTEHSQEIIIFFDQSGNIIECNQPAFDLLGYEEDIYQIKIFDIFRKAIKCVDNKIVIHDKFMNFIEETVAYRKNQTCFHVNLKLTVKKGRKNYIGACIARDLTGKSNVIHELRRTKQELKILRKSKNVFVANISHELRTPVNGIMGLTENLMETELTPKQLETVNIIHRCCISMNAIINDLLDYTKIENNKMILEQRIFCFRKFVNNIVAFNIHKINEKGLKFLVNIANDIPYRVIGDELRLSQILNNLISNAIKFTSVGHIALEVVKTEQTDSEVELFFIVMDTGIGISLEEKNKLFKSFTQVDGSITRRFGGTGLGLSISKLLVDAMGGSIKVESEKDKGSNFSFAVRLGYTETDEGIIAEEHNSECKYDMKHIGNFSDKKIMENTNSDGIDYIGKLLEEAQVSTNIIQDFSIKPEYISQIENEKVSKEMMDRLERLMLCIEMESWVKAEEFATMIRKQIPEDKKEQKNKALRLVLSVRKEDHDTSLILINELKEELNEVIEWKQ